MKITQLLGAALFAAAACQSPATNVLPSGQVVGEPIEARASLPFAVIDAAPSDHFEQVLLVEATVTAVCKTAGCWMQVEDEGRTAMVRWETGCGGQYRFPEDAIGKRVLVQGSFYPKTISPEDLEHLQEEAGEAIEVPAEGYEFNASSVLVMAN